MRNLPRNLPKPSFGNDPQSYLNPWELAPDLPGNEPGIPTCHPIRTQIHPPVKLTMALSAIAQPAMTPSHGAQQWCPRSRPTMAPPSNGTRMAPSQRAPYRPAIAPHPPPKSDPMPPLLLEARIRIALASWGKTVIAARVVRVVRAARVRAARVLIVLGVARVERVIRVVKAVRVVRAIGRSMNTKSSKLNCTRFGHCLQLSQDKSSTKTHTWDSSVEHFSVESMRPGWHFASRVYIGVEHAQLSHLRRWRGGHRTWSYSVKKVFGATIFNVTSFISYQSWDYSAKFHEHMMLSWNSIKGDLLKF